MNDTLINTDLETVLFELRRQLSVNKIPYLQRIKDSGRNIMVQCPYHGNGQEHNPSAGMKKVDGLFHCFACGEVHTLPEVISYCFGWDDMFGREGMKWLVKNFATVRKEERKDVKVDVERNNISSKSNILDSSSSDKHNYVTEEELDSYRYYHEYWAERGITGDDVIELFDLGYDKKTDSITFPVRDINGNCLFVARRNVKTKYFNYPKDVEKPLYGLWELRQKTVIRSVRDVITRDIKRETIIPDKIFITESMIDCILLWQSKHCAVALNGIGSDLQFKQLRDLPCRHLVLATDNDKAGQQARNKIRQNIKNKFFTEIAFPDNRKDIGECTQEEIRNIERWEVL